ncbi:UPF0481 protein [Camellia lanceoleosa]|uniref:UPF0481 protein n=1 Tax=Camellia lanceoleosa TaxID=1840588 RepID=A0ACC0G8P9_9ERIC|nr:UPF0481 protein [Camellia lanceoleosa]
MKRNLTRRLKAKKTLDEWIISINNKLAEVKRPLKLSIYKVPNKLVKLKEEAYTPSIVSIGPFHHKNKELLAFEEHKQRYMLHLFMRISEAAPSTLKECATAILDLEGEVRRCYSEYIEFDAQELAEILLVDGCFILELFLRHSDMEKYMDKVEEDPIINNASTIATLQHDLALLENQIPFPVLQTLFEIIKKHMPQPLPYSFTTTNSLVNLALLFLKPALGLTMSNKAVESKSETLTGDHLLDILHNFYVPRKFDRSQHGKQRSESRKCAGAARLVKAGIRLHVDTSSENLLDIKFKKGAVTMPPLHIQESITESIFRNLIAFEQCSIGTSHYIASYALLMKRLLSSSHDVEILRRRKIIINDLSDDDIGSGGDEVVTTLFKSMCDGVVLNDFCFSWLCEEVNDYPKACLDLCRLKARVMVICREYMLVLGAKYFVTPWTTLSVIAAGLILGFTAMQTYYSARTYYHQY